MSALLDARALSVVLAGREVVSDVAFTIAPGELIGLIGPNGAGKSTLLRAVAGLLPAGGQISLSGDPLASLAPAERARRLAFLPQEREVGWPLPVADLVALGREPRRRPGASLGRGDRAAIAEAMEVMDVAHLADRPASRLSGGERARVLIARALAQATPLLLADEPAAGLDPAHQISLMQVFSRLALSKERGLIVSLHDLSLAARWCTRLVLLDGGRIVADGRPREVLSAERLAAVYGITSQIDWSAAHPAILPTGLAR